MSNSGGPGRGSKPLLLEQLNIGVQGTLFDGRFSFSGMVTHIIRLPGGAGKMLVVLRVGEKSVGAFIADKQFFVEK